MEIDIASLNKCMWSHWREAGRQTLCLHHPNLDLHMFYHWYWSLFINIETIYIYIYRGEGESYFSASAWRSTGNVCSLAMVSRRMLGQIQSSYKSIELQRMDSQIQDGGLIWCIKIYNERERQKKNIIVIYLKLYINSTRSPMVWETWVQSQIESYQRL